MTDTLDALLSKTLFIDIETAPLWRSLDEIPPDPHDGAGNILVDHWEQRYAKDRPADQSPDEHFLNKAAVHAIYGRIVCIGLGWLGFRNGAWHWRETVLYDLNEKNLLDRFIHIWTEKFIPRPNSSEVATLCGHNLLNFDYIFLGRRMLMNGFSLPRPWSLSLSQPHWTLREFRLVDTMRLWGMGDSGGGGYISLEVLARVLGIPFRKSLSHHDIRECFYAWADTGDISHFEPVLSYCAEDVRTTARVYLHLIGRPELIPHVQRMEPNSHES